MSTSATAPFCANCNRTPGEINEYISAADVEDMTPDEYVRAEEGTLDRFTGAFLCTDCYYRLGQPSGRYGWTATPENLANLHLGVYGHNDLQPIEDAPADSLAAFKARLAQQLNIR